MEKIFESSLLGFKVILYSDHLFYKKGFMNKEFSIPLSEVSSIELFNPLTQKLRIRTTSGKKYDIIIRLSLKRKLYDLIMSQR